MLEGGVFGSERQPDLPPWYLRGGLWYPSAGYTTGEVELPTRNNGALYMTVNQENATKGR